jgi:2-oxoisovalerate dehydrogenase E1 component alpha subunit
MMADKKIDNLAPLRLHIPEPAYRPGDNPNFSEIAVPQVDEIPRPDESTHPSQMHNLAFGIVRVLDFDNQAKGSWNPNLNDDRLRLMLRNMMVLRAFDDRMFRAQRQGKTSFYMKSTGEEATSVATTMALDRQDMCFPSYRQQGILITREYPLVKMMNQIYSNSQDHLKGRQLPVMYSAPDYGFFSVSGNLTTQYPQAVGWAMASAAKGDTKIAAVWCGEGSTAEGDFHSALTFAAVYNAPVILQVVNNQWAISSFSGFAGSERTTFAARAVGYGIAGLRVDGNDPLAVYAAMQWASNRARTNNGPTLIEYFTYRAEGHSTSDDPSAYRAAEEFAKWPMGDPVNRLKDHLIAIGAWSEEQHLVQSDEIVNYVKAQQKEAEKNGTLGHGLHQPFETMFEDVFEDEPWHLKEQCAQMLAEQRSKFGPEWQPK